MLEDGPRQSPTMYIQSSSSVGCALVHTAAHASGLLRAARSARYAGSAAQRW